MAALALVGDECAVLDAPISLSCAVPVAHGLAVGQRNPARAGLADGLRRKLNGGEAGSEQRNVSRNRAYHDAVLPVSDGVAAERPRFFHFDSRSSRILGVNAMSAIDGSKRRGSGEGAGMFHSVGARGRTYASRQKDWESAVAMSPPGTKLPIRNVRSPVANEGKADNICLF